MKWTKIVINILINADLFSLSSFTSFKNLVSMSSYFFSTPTDIDIVLDNNDDKATVDLKLDKNRREKAPVYMDGESVKGAVTIRPKDGKRLEHTGIKVQFIGTIGTSICVPTPTAHLLRTLSNRNVFWSRKSSWISVLGARVGGSRRPSASADVWLQLQECGEAVRVVQRNQCQTSLFCPGDHFTANAWCDQREGFMGLLIPYSSGDQ